MFLNFCSVISYFPLFLPNRALYDSFGLVDPIYDPLDILDRTCLLPPYRDPEILLASSYPFAELLKFLLYDPPKNVVYFRINCYGFDSSSFWAYFFLIFSTSTFRSLFPTYPLVYFGSLLKLCPGMLNFYKGDGSR